MSFDFNSLPALPGPSKVTGVSLSKELKEGTPTLRVTWTIPQSDLNISEYIVRFRKNGASAWDNPVIISHATTTTQLPALDVGTEYDVRVRANSAAVEGEWSEVQTETTFNSQFTCIICCYQLHVHL